MTFYNINVYIYIKPFLYELFVIKVPPHTKSPSVDLRNTIHGLELYLAIVPLTTLTALFDSVIIPQFGSRN